MPLSTPVIRLFDRLRSSLFPIQPFSIRPAQSQLEKGTVPISAKRKPKRTVRPDKSPRRKPRPKPAAKPAARGAEGIKYTWKNLGPTAAPGGRSYDRQFQLATLARAVERRIETIDAFIGPSIAEAMGTAPLAAMQFALDYEAFDRLVFHVGVTNANKTRGQFGLVVAKTPAGASKQLETELRHMHVLRERAGEWVLRAHRGGTVYLPDRRRRKEHARELFALVTDWLPGYDRLGVGKSDQFTVNPSGTGKDARLLRRDDSEAIRTQLVEIVARCYDAEAAEGLSVEGLEASDIAVKRTPGGKMRVRIVQCRRMHTRQRPGRMMESLLRGQIAQGDRTATLTPRDPAAFWAGLCGGAGTESARRYIHSVTGRAAKDYRDYLDAALAAGGGG